MLSTLKKTKNFIGFVEHRSCRAYFFQKPENVLMNIRVALFESNGFVWLRLLGTERKNPPEKFISDSEESTKYLINEYGLKEALKRFNMIETNRVNNNRYL